jgi:hypothetical protein
LIGYPIPFELCDDEFLYYSHIHLIFNNSINMLSSDLEFLSNREIVMYIGVEPFGSICL